MPSAPRRSASGFTLIELMIVVAIIAILAAIAVPQYKDYLIRSQISEGMITAAGAKAAVWEYKHNTGHFPPSNLSAGMPSGTSIAGKYVSSVAIQPSGVILVSYAKPDANDILRNGGTVSLSPIDNTGSIGWKCSANVPDRYMPSSCRSN